MNKKLFIAGIKAGLPIGLGYLSVSFTFGIMAISAGLYWWQALLISMLNLTSAGQLAGINIMIHPMQYIEMLIAQLTINIRYSFMSVSLSQKTDTSFKMIDRWILGAFVTDEIFGVAVTQEKVNKYFFAGLTVLPYIGWALGTLLGAVLGNVLPDIIMNALNIALYAMFIAIVIPEAKKSLAISIVSLIAIGLSCMFYFVPMLSSISSGLTICISAIVATCIGAILFPVKILPEEEQEESPERSINNG